jgi:hypothetical protein
MPLVEDYTVATHDLQAVINHLERFKSVRRWYNRTTGAKNWWMAHYRRWYTFSIPGVASEDATEAGGSAREAGVGTSATMQDPTTTTQPLKVAMAGALGIS